MSIANNARDMLAQAEHALQRIDNGTYGVCELRQPDREGASSAAFPVPRCACHANSARSVAERRIQLRPRPLCGVGACPSCSRSRSLCALDQVTKYLAVRYLSDRDPIPLIDGLLGLRLVRNSARPSASAPG